MKIYLVGGAVRDEIMGRPSVDKDYVVVGSTPQQMLDAGFLQVGAAFPVFLHPQTGDEYALARTEKKSGPGYQGFNVEFENVTLEEDLLRRDLTINSIAKDMDTGEYIDPYGGIQHINEGILQATSDAFEDDPLRVVRLARFAARFGFSLSASTERKAVDMICSGQLNELPYERFWAEVKKVINEPAAWEFFYLLKQWGAYDFTDFFSEMFDESFSDRSVEHLLRACQHRLPPDKVMTIFFAFIAKKVVHGGSSELMTLHKILRLIPVSTKMTADNFYPVLKATRAWAPGVSFENLVLAIKAVGHSVLSENMLLEIQAAVSTVKAEHFAPLEGKELGVKIEMARKEKLAEIIK